MANSNLGAAKKAQNDEFYTQYHDIEKEMNSYLDFDANVFRGKTVLLPCDDPEWSNFTKYFAQNFDRLGLKKLISTSFAPDSKPAEIEYQPTLFETDDPTYDKTKTRTQGKIFILEKDQNGDGRTDVHDLKWHYLEGDGDFRSAEVSALRDEADLVVTNPPFSLFSQFVVWLTEASKDFVILGNMNAITYREVFPLIRDNKVWLGVTRTGVGFMWFEVVENAPDKTGQKIENGKRYQTIGNSAWFTTLDHGRRHQPLALMSQQDNVRFSKHKEVRGVGYSKYDNYDALEVPWVDAIPSDFEGVMGVPISFLGKHNPHQFEILGCSYDYGRPEIWHESTRMSPTVDGKNIYKRLFIRHKTS